ncbi:MAG: Hsp20/alpha crystallin family protein [Myxococcota bacterium]
MSASDSALRQLESLLTRDPLLKDLMTGTLPGPRKSGRFQPDVDVFELKGEYRVVLDVPGVKREDIDVQLDGGRLLVRGKRSTGAPKGASVRTSERGKGSFERAFLLPNHTVAGEVQAHLDHGVLTVIVPVGEGDRSRRVTVTGD